MIISTELSWRSVHSVRIFEQFPFLRSRYGRSSVYMFSGLALGLLNSDTTFSLLLTNTIAFAGMLFGLIAMQPENPLDYRGFQRPNSNDFLSRIQAAGA